MVFHHPNKKPINNQLKINNINIERVTDFCFLGLTINEHLTWKTHIDKISNKVSKFNGILNKLKNFVPQQVLRSLYCSLIQSQINYCILAWGTDTNNYLNIKKDQLE